jgi:diguanylate cyclase (GGDEF)-like protein
VERLASRCAAWDATEAAWAALAVMLAAAGLLVVDGATTDYSSSAKLGNYGLMAFLVVLSLVMARFGGRLPVSCFVLIPISCSIVLTAMSFAKQDAGAAALLASTLPVFYAAAVLRPLGSHLVLAYNAISDAALLFSFLPADEAFRDLSYLLVAIGSSSLLLTRSNSRQRKLADLLAAQAGVDALTGLVTRRVLDEAAHGAITAGQSTVGTALLLIDVDRFKAINDTYGHPVGDDALKHLAEVLAANTRPDCVVGRLGGDELAVLLPGCENSVAVRRAEHLVRAVRKSPLTLPNGDHLPISVSIGVAHAPTDGRDLPQLYASADAALYNAKRGGRDQVGLRA